MIVVDSTLETAPKQLKDSEAKLMPELPECQKKLKVCHVHMCACTAVKP